MYDRVYTANLFMPGDTDAHAAASCARFCNQIVSTSLAGFSTWQSPGNQNTYCYCFFDNGQLPVTIPQGSTALDQQSGGTGEITGLNSNTFYKCYKHSVRFHSVLFCKNRFLAEASCSRLSFSSFFIILKHFAYILELCDSSPDVSAFNAAFQVANKAADQNPYSKSD